MASLVRIKGVRAVLRNLAREGKSTERGVQRGLVKAGLFLQAESQRIVPVDTGNLKGSAFTRREGSGHRTQVQVGYTAAYALFVHEDLNARHKPGKTAKYLERPAREHRNRLREIVRGEASR